MISKTEEQVLDRCISQCSVESRLEKHYFTKEEIESCVPEGGIFDFNSFKTFINKRNKHWCSNCGESFSLCDHADDKLIQKIVYTLDVKSICSEVIDSATKAGPLNNTEEKAPIEGIYQVRVHFGKREVIFVFFSEREHYLNSDIDPLNLEFPVLLRDFAVEKHEEYRFSWREVLSESFREKLLSQVSTIKNKTTAVFAEYTESFVKDHRTEIKSAVCDYFDRSGYKPHTEVSDKCPEIEQYGIKAEHADYVFIREDDTNEKILITHGEMRDNGWYAQRFINGKLVSVEGDPIFKDLSTQIDDKITYYKRISKQLSSSSQYMRGLAGLVVIVTTLLTVVNINEISMLFQNHVQLDQYSDVASVLLLSLNTILSGILVTMLFAPYIRERTFSWKMYSSGSSRSRFKIYRHMKIGTE